MKQRKYISLIVLGVLLTGALGLPACYKDKGNYQYHQINDITITTVADTFRINQLDTLHIIPVIQAALDTNQGRLKFEWDVYLDPEQAVDTTEPEHASIVVLSTQRNLYKQITLNPEAKGYYNLTLKVTDTVTGVSYYKPLYLYVSSDLQTGWMLAEQYTDHGDISMITPNDSAYHSVFSSANPGLTLSNTVFQVQGYYIYAGGMNATNYVLTSTGGYYLDHNTLKADQSYSQMFYGVAPSVIQPETMANPSYYTGLYTINAGQAYCLNAMYGESAFGLPETAPDNLGVSLAPYMTASYLYGGIFFDQLNFRFLLDNEGSTLITFPSSASAGGPFNMGYVHKQMLTMQPGLGDPLSPNNVYAIFKDLNDDSCFLYTLNPYANTIPIGYQPILNSPGVGSSPAYVFSSSVQQMYYASGNVVYLYDMAAGVSRVAYSFSGGENITTMQLSQSGTSLVVATYTSGTQGGSVYYLPIAPTGDIQGGQYSNKFTGFGKIVNMAYKQG